MAIPLPMERLYSRYPNPWKDRFVKATKSDLDALQAKLGVRLPEEYRDWMTYMDNLVAGAGYLYSVKRNPPISALIYDVYERYPTWVKKHWIPIADDGLGNTFVMVVSTATDSAPVVLLYDAIDPDVPSCVVASTLFRFLEFFLESGLTRTDTYWWQEGKNALIARDPGLLKIHGLPPPWDPAG